MSMDSTGYIFKYKKSVEVQAPIRVSCDLLMVQLRKDGTSLSHKPHRNNHPNKRHMPVFSQLNPMVLVKAFRLYFLWYLDLLLFLPE